MRQLSLACLFVLAALVTTGCANKNMLSKGGGCGCSSGGCSSCYSGGCGGGGCMTCRPGSGRMYGQNNDSMVCRGGGNGMFGRGGGFAASEGGCNIGGHLASGWRGGCNNDEYRMDDGPGGPPGAQVAYPYYTTRGPRDFFADNPPSIGP